MRKYLVRSKSMNQLLIYIKNLDTLTGNKLQKTNHRNCCFFFLFLLFLPINGYGKMRSIVEFEQYTEKKIEFLQDIGRILLMKYFPILNKNNNNHNGVMQIVRTANAFIQIKLTFKWVFCAHCPLTIWLSTTKTKPSVHGQWDVYWMCTLLGLNSNALFFLLSIYNNGIREGRGNKSFISNIFINLDLNTPTVPLEIWRH